MALSNDLRRIGCLGKPFVHDVPPRYLVVWAGAVHDVLPSNEYDPEAFDLFETVNRISSIYGFEFERVELIVLKISNWCQSAMKWRKCRTLFEFTRFVKGELVPIRLPQERVAELLGCSQQDVSNLIKRAMKDGFIDRVSGARYSHGLSAQYRFKSRRI